MTKPDAKTPLLARRWVRTAIGLVLVGLCSALGGAAWSLPFVEIRAGTLVYPLDGPTQTGNLHLVLVATGVLGALLGVLYAASRLSMRYAFFVVGGVASLFSGLLWLGTYHTVKYAQIADAALYDKIRGQDVEMAVGSALWTALFASAAIVGVAVLVWRAGAFAPPPKPPKPRRV